MLQTKKCTPTFLFSDVSTFGLAFESFKDCGGASIGGQMGAPICCRTKILIYSKLWLDFGNYN
jgi:hypothetical protein